MFLSAGLGILICGFLAFKENPPLLRYRLHFAAPGFQSSALVILALEQGFFALEGIDASLEYKATGRECLDLVINKGADLAVVFETPVVHATIAGHSLHVLSELHRSDTNTAVVAHRDQGIKAAQDLKGKTIAVVPKTNAEFLLDLYLRSHLINASEVKIVEMPIADVLKAFSAKKIDAAALWAPYVGQVMAKDPASFTRLQSSYYSEFSVLASLRHRWDRDPEEAMAVLRGLKRASDFYRKEGPRARAIVDRKLQDLGFFVAEETWQSIDINIGLSSTLLTMLNEEINWIRLRAGQAERFDMRSSLESRYVKAVAPEQVTFE